MQALKTITIEPIDSDKEYRVEIADSYTDASIVNCVASDRESVHKIRGFMNWHVRIFTGDRLIYEENPFSIAPPKREPKISVPVCMVGIRRDEGKVTVYQFWDAKNSTNLGQRVKRHYEGTCVIRMGGLGDLISLTSSLQALKEKEPKERLTLATLPQFVDLFKSAPFLDNCVNINDLEYARFDKTIDLRWSVEPPGMGNGRAKLEEYSECDRSDLFDKRLSVYPSQKRYWLPAGVTSSYIDQISTTPAIMLNAAMVSPARSVIPSYVGTLCDMIAAKTPYNIVLVGQTQPWNSSLKNIQGNRILNLINDTTIEELISICAASALVVTPDTGTLHIAGALGKRTLALFGNINPRTRISYYQNVRALYPHGAFPCVPCWDMTHHCVNEPEAGSRCMRLLTPSIIMAAIEEELKNGRPVQRTGQQYFADSINYDAPKSELQSERTAEDE